MATLLSRVTAILLASIFAFATFAQAEEGTPNELDKAAVEKIIQEYIMNNPEIVIQAFAKFEEQERLRELERAQQALTDNWDAIVNDPLAFVAGNPKGDVTIVEYFDYNCGWCRRATPDIVTLMESDPNIRVVFKEFPIRGSDSEQVAKAALATISQDKYFELHQQSMVAEGQMNLARFEQMAEQAGVDLAKLREDMASPKIAAAIEINRAQAQSLYIEGTPSFIVGDQIVRGWPGLDGLRKLVAAARAPKQDTSN